MRRLLKCSSYTPCCTRRAHVCICIHISAIISILRLPEFHINSTSLIPQNVSLHPPTFPRHIMLLHNLHIRPLNPLNEYQGKFPSTIIITRSHWFRLATTNNTASKRIFRVYEWRINVLLPVFYTERSRWTLSRSIEGRSCAAVSETTTPWYGVLYQ